MPHKLALPVPLGLGLATRELQDKDQEAEGAEAAGEAMDVVLGDHGDGTVAAMEEDTVAEDGGRVGAGVGVARHSPLTYGKVFGAIPRMTKAINTPTINQRISAAFGLPALRNSTDFKRIYSSGREALR